MSPGPTQKFNDDLLLTEEDQKLAMESFPELVDVLDFRELREMFRSYDLAANNAKKLRRRVGFIAILLAVLALLGASAAPLYETRPDQGPVADSSKFVPQGLDGVHREVWPRVLAGFSAVLGVVSVLIGSFAMLNGKSKLRWLCNRLMTERLRQFQFQLLVYRIPEVLASIGNESGRKRFMDARRSWFAEFRLTYEGHLLARLKAFLDDDAEEDFLLHHNVESWPPRSIEDTGLSRVFSAYRLLRFEHQLQYANYELREDESSFSGSSARQLKILRELSLGFIGIVFVAHLIVAFSLVPGWSALASNSYVHLGIIWVVIGILALRTLEEGLQPTREVERYTRYRSSLASLLARFDKATDAEEKIRIMQETERVAYQETRGFLKTNYEARYVL
jgi:hypothetical protein